MRAEEEKDITAASHRLSRKERVSSNVLRGRRGLKGGGAGAAGECVSLCVCVCVSSVMESG